MGTTANGIVYPDASSPVGSIRAHLQQLAETADAAAIGGAWSTFTPTWTATTTNPGIGNGTLVGRYRQTGKTVDFYIGLLMGSTTTYGSGAWLFALPSAPLSALRWPAQVVAFDASAGQQFAGPAAWVSSLSRLAPNTGVSPTASVLSTSPFTWATSDTLVITGTYEAA